MKHLKTYEGLKDWFKKSPKKEEEKSVIFNKEKTKEELEEEARLERNKIDEFITNNLDIVAIQSVDKLDIGSNEWLVHLINKDSKIIGVYNIKLTKEFMNSKLNEVESPKEFKELIGDVHVLLSVTMPRDNEYYIGIHTICEINEMVNEKRAARRMIRYNDNFTPIGDNTIGIDSNKTIQYDTIIDMKTSAVSDYTRTYLTKYLNTGMVNILDVMSRKTFNYNRVVKTITRRAKLHVHFENIKTFFYDISDIVDSFEIEAEDSGIVVTLESKEFKSGGYGSGSFILTDKVSNIFESLVEIKSRVLELVPGCKFHIRIVDEGGGHKEKMIINIG